jgi:hypothetical protein
MEVTIDFDIDLTDDVNWTLGNNSDLSYRRSIDSGATGEVHEVSPNSKLGTDR